MEGITHLVPTLLPLIFVLIGGFIVLKGIISFLKKRKLAQIALTTTGTVTTVAWQSIGTGNTQAHKPTIRFETNQGQTIEFTESENLNNWTFYKIGQQLPISYDQQNPHQARIGTPSSLANFFSLSSILPVLVGGGFILIGGNMLFSPFGLFSSGGRSPTSASSRQTAPKVVPPVSSKLQINIACSEPQGNWVWVEGYPGAGIYRPSSNTDKVSLDFYSRPGGGDRCSIWVTQWHVKSWPEGSPKEVRLRISEGGVAEFDTKVLVLGQVISRNGNCELDNVSDVRLP